MCPPRIFAVGAAMVIGWFVWLALAQEDRSNAPREGDVAQLYSYPAPDYHASFDLHFGERQSRRLHIHRENPLTNRVGCYYHRPLFALVTSPRLIDGYPSYVHAVDPMSNPGKIELTFRILLSTPRCRVLCERKVYEQDLRYVINGLSGLADRAERERPPADVIQVFRWPVEEIEVHCIRKGTQEVLATAHVGGLPNVTESFDCVMPFTPEALGRFDQLARVNAIAFLFYYSYTGVQAATAVRDVVGLKDIHLVAKQELTSQQVDGTVPIFQSDVDRVERAITTRINSTTRLEHKDLLPVLSSMVPLVMGKLFDPVNDISLEELSSQYPQAKSQIAAYLAPHLQSLSKVEGVTKLTVDTTERENISVYDRNLGGSTGVSFPIGKALAKINIFGSLAKEDAERDLKRWESASGVKTETVEQGTRFAAHEIHTYSLAEHWDQATLEQSDTVFLAVGEQGRYRVDDEVSPEFNDDSVAKAIEVALAYSAEGGGTSERPTFEGIQLGMMIPYFGSGAIPPRGFVWADGKTRWPNASWVPEHMRDGVGDDDFVPNMNGYLLGGSEELAEIGTAYTQGVVTVPITGNNFVITLPSLSHSTVSLWTLDVEFPQNWNSARDYLLADQAGGMGNRDCPIYANAMPGRAGYDAGRTNNVGYLQLAKTEFESNAKYAEEVKPTVAYQDGTQDAQKTLKGPLHDASTLPRHYRCRWIIRVR